MLILSIKRKAGYYRDSLKGIKSSLSLRESNFNRSSLDLKFVGTEFDAGGSRFEVRREVAARNSKLGVGEVVDKKFAA